MNDSLPKTPRQLHWMLARRMSLAALAIGLLAGLAAYWLQAQRAENAVIERIADGLRHFESPAMQLLARDAVSQGHEALDALRNRGQLIGVRVFNPGGTIFYENWVGTPSTIVETIRQQETEWPAAGKTQRSWIELKGERLIRVVLPVVSSNGILVGYMEGTNLLDSVALRTQKEQVLSGVLAAVLSVVTTTFLLYPLLLAMLKRSNGLSRRLLDANLSLIKSLGNAVAKRDSDTDAHNYRVTYYAVSLAEAMRVPDKAVAELVVGAFLHDVGKIGIPDSILLKPGKLTADEFEVMKTHSLLGIEIVADNPWLAGAALTIRHHHERYDGTGYPDGLRGEAIPYTARIFAIVDVFDALTSERPYKKPMAFADAMAIIARDSGGHFDPNVVLAFIEIAPSLYSIASHASEGELRLTMAEVLSRYFKYGN